VRGVVVRDNNNASVRLVRLFLLEIDKRESWG
jgi:hypothetical protein